MCSGFLHYQIDEKQERLKRRLLRQKVQNKRFKDQEYITDLYKKNLDLHRKLDIIQKNGTGISSREKDVNAPLASSFATLKWVPLQVRNPSRGH
jgi:hypothetical protein